MNAAWRRAIEGVEALHEEVPKTKTGLIRRALPQIDQAQAEGHSLKTIWRRFHDGGLDVQYKHFCAYLARVRSQQKRLARLNVGKGQPHSGSESTVQEQPAQPVRRDPFANLRRVEANRPGFNYRGTQDLEELVYGNKGKSDKKQ